MKQAIENNILTRYYYYPKIVNLENYEREEYLKVTRELAKYIDSTTGKYKETEYVSLLLIKRKSIIHKAVQKINALLKIVEEIGPHDFRDALIYVPEGMPSEYNVGNENAENSNLIDIYLLKLYDKFNLRMAKLTGETKNREDVLNQFKDHRIDVLLAMKCLDEGVDIPQAKYAIFCSSTGNPRQYIQRRGRVLRVHTGKQFAIIYDLIVKPIIDHTETDAKLRNVERNIFLSEIKRLVNFSVLSENKDSCLAQLEGLCEDLNIDIYELANNELKNFEI
jgi:superfamily II DNA or RNA helicase